MPRLHLIHVARIQVVGLSICIACRRLHVSCIGTKLSLTRHYGDMDPLVFGYMHVSGVNAASGKRG